MPPSLAVGATTPLLLPCGRSSPPPVLASASLPPPSTSRPHPALPPHASFSIEVLFYREPLFLRPRASSFAGVLLCSELLFLHPESLVLRPSASPPPAFPRAAGPHAAPCASPSLAFVELPMLLGLGEAPAVAGLGGATTAAGVGRSSHRRWLGQISRQPAATGSGVAPPRHRRHQRRAEHRRSLKEESQIQIYNISIQT